jgi:transcriptional regulator with XRE-family HTH domain
MAMDDLRTGTLARAVRHRLHWTQRELATRAGVSQTLVSLFERGHLEELTVRSARRIAIALEIQLPFAPRWRGGDGVRLMDNDHAALVDQVVRMLRHHDWEVVVEYTFSHYGERGSVDILAWHAEGHALLIIEVKSRLLDSQETIATLARKARIVPQLLLKERGWRPTAIGMVLAMDELTANRSAVGRLSSTFDTTYPARGRTVRSWIRQPDGPLAGLWFLSASNTATGTRARGSRKRVRRAPPSVRPERDVA